jgi:hypothetical protein
VRRRASCIRSVYPLALGRCRAREFGDGRKDALPYREAFVLPPANSLSARRAAPIATSGPCRSTKRLAARYMSRLSIMRVGYHSVEKKNAVTTDATVVIATQVAGSAIAPLSNAPRRSPLLALTALLARGSGNHFRMSRPPTGTPQGPLPGCPRMIYFSGKTLAKGRLQWVYALAEDRLRARLS